MTALPSVLRRPSAGCAEGCERRRQRTTLRTAGISASLACASAGAFVCGPMLTDDIIFRPGCALKMVLARLGILRGERVSRGSPVAACAPVRCGQRVQLLRRVAYVSHLHRGACELRNDQHARAVRRGALRLFRRLPSARRPRQSPRTARAAAPPHVDRLSCSIYP